MLIIDVTQQDINSGCVKHYRNCAIALAAERIFCSPASVAVTIEKIGTEESWDISRNEEIQQWITDFDAGKTVSPIKIGLLDNGTGELLAVVPPMPMEIPVPA